MNNAEPPRLLRRVCIATRESANFLAARASPPIRIVVMISWLLLSWLPLALPCYQLIPDSNLVSIVTLVGLYVEFIAWLWIWGRWIDRKPQVWATYGFWGGWQFGREVWRGFLGAAGCLWLLFLGEGAMGWLQWHSPQTAQPFLQVLLEGSLVGVGIGLAEELFFRGWLLSELAREYPPRVGLMVTSLIFAALHFIKPLPDILATLPQLAGLLILGATLVWARWVTQGRLGFSIGLHAGLVGSYYWLNVGGLTRYTHQVPDWVTGINNNPLAGLSGLSTLGLLAVLVRKIPPSKAI